jgi:hypothetical protein
MATEVQFVPDRILRTLVEVAGPDSVENQIWKQLRDERAKDRQVFAFRVGEYWLTCPFPDARTELHLIHLAYLKDLAAEADD